MRILWFTGVQLPAVTGQDLSRAGWQEGLRRALEMFQPGVDLRIASFGDKPYAPLHQGNATYYHISRNPPPETRFGQVLANWQNRLYYPSELDSCRQIVDQVSPDLIYIFGTENPFGLLIEEWSIPVIISIQAVLNGLIEHIFDGLSPGERLRFLFSKDTLLGGGVYHKYLRLRRSRRMEKKIYRSCSFFEGRTDWDLDWVKRLSPDAAYFHIDRVVGEAFYQAEWEEPQNPAPILYTTSSNAPFKGGLTLARAFLELHRRGHHHLRLHMAGIHPQSLVGRSIQRLLKGGQVDTHLTLLGRVHRQEIVREMGNAAMFILPSHMDNSPNSLAEAMLMGMPCVASSAGGIPSMITDRRTGLIYPHQDVEALADCIETLLENPALAKDLGRAARAAAFSRHDPRKIANQTVKMYQRVLQR